MGSKPSLERELSFKCVLLTFDPGTDRQTIFFHMTLLSVEGTSNRKDCFLRKKEKNLLLSITEKVDSAFEFPISNCLWYYFILNNIIQQIGLYSDEFSLPSVHTISNIFAWNNPFYQKKEKTHTALRHSTVDHLRRNYKKPIKTIKRSHVSIDY